MRKNLEFSGVSSLLVRGLTRRNVKLNLNVRASLHLLMYKVKVHRKGIIVIPKEVRDKLNIKEGDEVSVVVDDHGIYIFPNENIEKYFGSDKDAIEALKVLEEERRKERESRT